jgi:peptidoglycan/xylan/chitin deacetylase (PgdA/CDA1 family)
VPHYFVARSTFDAQLRYLSSHAVVLPLADAVQKLKDGTLPPRSVSITFDDGYANNVHLAYPLLRKYRMPATVFLSSAGVETGDFFPFLKVKLIQLALRGSVMPDYERTPLETLMQAAAPLWQQVRPRLTADQSSTLRPMTIGEAQSMQPDLIELGAHTDTHCILGNENEERRRNEICNSIKKVSKWSGRPVRLFSYPNGQRADFGDIDKRVLREAGIQATVCGLPGANSRHTDPLELRRYPVGMFHGENATFSAEVAGLRSMLRAVAGAMGA